MKKERVGNRTASFAPMGATGHALLERVAGDFYATDPRAVDALEYAGKLPMNKKIWECAAGQGDLSEALIRRGYEVISTDLFDRGYCAGGTDFLQTTELLAPCIFTNPPYIHGTDFCTHAIKLGADEVYMFVKLQFLEGKRRHRELYSKNPPAEILQFVGQMSAARNGDRSKFGKSAAIPFCWMIWRRGHKGKSQLSWISAEKGLITTNAA